MWIKLCGCSNAPTLLTSEKRFHANIKQMQVDLFDFHLPQTSIAQTPVSPRDSAKLLHVSSDGNYTDYIFKDLPDLVNPGDVLVCNNTKVIPARLYGKRGEANIELMLHKHNGQTEWEILAKPAKRLRIGDRVTLQGKNEASIEVKAKHDNGMVTIAWITNKDEMWQQIHQCGIMPLPPYITRDKQGKDEDKYDYQTMFAQHEGAVAAPTAGLHFTPELIQTLQAKHIEIVEVTLHVGAGTFLPVKVEDTKDHQMHSEVGYVSSEAAAAINNAKQKGGNVIAVGTTSLRIIESAATASGKIEAFAGETSIFITPGYDFKIMDKLITNFHLPKSTLFMLVSAVSGLNTMQQAYRYAIEHEYRFYSYGDACLLERKKNND